MIDIVVVITLASFVNRWAPLDQPKPTVPELVTPPPIAEPAAPHAQHHPPKPRDICARTGGHRQDYTKNHWRYWRCVYGR